LPWFGHPSRYTPSLSNKNVGALANVFAYHFIEPA
jgi:hypothetical protein